MKNAGLSWMRRTVVMLLSVAVVFAAAGAQAENKDAGKALYAAKCAVCHGGDRSGYIGPALNPQSLKRFAEGQLVAKAAGASSTPPRWRQ